MFKYRIIPLIKDWLKITVKEILPIFLEALKKLTVSLIETYKEENFKKLQELKKEADLIKEEKRKINE